MGRRKICVVTGTRAEYGLLYWLMKEIEQDRDLELQIIATGMHLSPEFGLTYQNIEYDGFIINEKVEMLLSSDTPTGVSKSIGLGVIGFSDAYLRLNPDIVVLLGDRYEALAAAQAAMVARIPMAHIHGGEVTEGVIDEPIRHSITKMSHIHFVASRIYKKRVVQLGEHPDTVFNFGAPGLDHIKRMKLLSKSQLEEAIDCHLGELSFLITYHPVTLSEKKSVQAVNNLLCALDDFPQATIIITKSNSDTEGRMMNQRLEAYAKTNAERVKIFTSLGQLKYLSALQHVDVVIGNSSSGLTEAPVFKKATVNIGDRQRGRLKASSVIDCEESTEAIRKAIEQALSDHFQRSLQKTVSLYGQGDVSSGIKQHLKNVDLKNIIMKKFYDVGVDV